MELREFEGRWRLEREIEDLAAGRAGRFVGEAAFAAVAGGLDYAETGTLVLDGAAPMAASRRYRWIDAGGAAVDVAFEDGRLFHRIDLAAARPAALHACGPDLYRVRYDFRDWPRWQAEWRVSGPRKDYAMVSRYLRLHARVIVEDHTAPCSPRN